MGNPKIAEYGAATRFKPGPDPRRKPNGVSKKVSVDMDRALGIALVEAIDVIVNPRNPYYQEHRIHMIETIIRYCVPKRKEIAVEGDGSLLGFDPTKWFKPDSGPEPVIDVTAEPVKQNGFKNGVKIKVMEEEDDED